MSGRSRWADGPASDSVPANTKLGPRSRDRTLPLACGGSDDWSGVAEGKAYFTRREPTRAIDYEEAYWGQVVDPDGKLRDRSQERDQHLEDLKEELDYLHRLAGGKLLDVGCGLGFLLSGLDERWERHGLEVSARAAAHARRYATVHQGELQSAGLADAAFDAIVAHHVIEHVDDPIQFLRGLFRLLREEGVLVLGTPDFDSGCARRFGGRYRLLHDATHVSLFSAESMRRLLLDEGFVIDRVAFPFFETRHFTSANLQRLFDRSQTSPPFYGNFMTFYCRKPRRASAYREVMQLRRALAEFAAALVEDETCADTDGLGPDEGQRSDALAQVRALRHALSRG